MHLKRNKNDPFMKTIIIGDIKWDIAAKSFFKTSHSLNMENQHKLH